MKGEVKEIVNCRIDHGKRFFEVIWKSTWEEEEVVRSLADDLVEQFLKTSVPLHADTGDSNGYNGNNEEEYFSGDDDRLQINEDFVEHDELENETCDVSQAPAALPENSRPKKNRKVGINSIISRLQKTQQEGLLRTPDDQHNIADKFQQQQQQQQKQQQPHQHSGSVHNLTQNSRTPTPGDSINSEQPVSWKQTNSGNNDQRSLLSQQRVLTPTQERISPSLRSTPVLQCQDMGMESNAGTRRDDYEACSPVGPREASLATNDAALPTQNAALLPSCDDGSSSLQNLQTNVDNIPKLFPGTNGESVPEGSLQDQLRKKHAHMEAQPELPDNVHLASSSLKCPICSEVFFEESKFKQHMFMHEQVSLLRQETPKLLKPGTFECKFCHILFDDKDKLKTHYTDEHEKEFVHTQPMDQLYQCALCDETFVDYNKLIHHHQTHQQGQPREAYMLPKKQQQGFLPIDPRETQTTNGPTLVHHRASPLTAEEPAQGSRNTSPSTLENRRPFNSNSSSENLEKFDDVFEDEKDGIKAGVLDNGMPSNVKKEVEYDGMTTEYAGEKKLFRCNLCDELFENEDDRARHSLVHVNRSSSLDCHICGKQFKHRTNLSTHLIVHSGKKPHQCHICLRRFTQKVNLQRHMHIHDGSRPFTCRMCSKSFTQKANLQRHILSHTEHSKEELLIALSEIPNESEVNNAINESLTEAMSVVMEQKQTDAELGDATTEYRCVVCDQIFTGKANLDQHMLTHSGETLTSTPTSAPNPLPTQTSITPTTQRSFQCYVCGKTFRQRAALQKHYSVHTTGSSTFVCQTCNRVFGSRTNLQRHMLGHAPPGQLQCYLCDQKFQTTENLERHFSEHIEESAPVVPVPSKYLEQSGTPGQQFRCGTCEIVFDSPVVFSQHLQCHQNQFPSETTPNDVDMSGRVPNHSSPPKVHLKCHTCGIMCIGYEALEEHMLVHHNIPEQPPRGTESKYNIEQRSLQRSPHHMEQQARTWTPPQAQISPRMGSPSETSNLEGSTMVKQELLTPHAAAGTARVPRVSRCPVCKKVFASKKEMRIHYSMTHIEASLTPKDDPDLLASEPPVSMLEPSSYAQMMQAEAAGIPVVEPVPEEDISVPEEPYDPDNPDEAFHVAVITESEERLIKENADFIKDNILGGPGEYESKGRYERGNYSCKICNRVLTYKYSLEKHMLLHTGSFPYKCHLCSKRFNHKANYDKHLVVHRGEKPYSCHICARPFSQKSNLQRHQLTHTQNRDFICDVCGKRFNHMASLKTHTLIHTGAKPFSCYICTKRFNQKGNLKRHIQTHRTGKRNKINGLDHDPDIDEMIKGEIVAMAPTGDHIEQQHRENIEAPREQQPMIVKAEAYPENNSSTASIASAYSYIPKESVTMVTMHEDDSFYARAAKVHHELTQQEAQTQFLKEHNIKLEKVDNAAARRSQRPPKKKNVDDYHEFIEYEDPLPTMIGGDGSYQNQPTNSQPKKSQQKQPGQPLSQQQSGLPEKNPMQYPVGFEGEQILTVMPSDAVYADEQTDRKPFIETKFDKDRSETFNCQQCSKVFISLASLEAHKKHAHSYIMCDICGRPFSQKANLLKHKLIHANKKPFACRVCNKAFRQKANLQRHELIHDKDRKTVNCTECNKSFRCAWSLKQHMKNHNSAGGAYGCSICGKTFKGKDRLMQHFAVHNQMGGLTCHICSIKLPSPELLLKHLETHGSYPVPAEEGMPVPAEGLPGSEGKQLAWVPTIATSASGGEATVFVANPDEHRIITEYSNGNSPIAIVTNAENTFHHIPAPTNSEITNGKEVAVKSLNGNEAITHAYAAPRHGLPVHVPFEDGTIVAVQHGEHIPMVASSMSGLVVVTNATS